MELAKHNEIFLGQLGHDRTALEMIIGLISEFNSERCAKEARRREIDTKIPNLLPRFYNLPINITQRHQILLGLLSTLNHIQHPKLKNP
jgi:hypothetical protein